MIGFRASRRGSDTAASYGRILHRRRSTPSATTTDSHPLKPLRCHDGRGPNRRLPAQDERRRRRTGHDGDVLETQGHAALVGHARRSTIVNLLPLEHEATIDMASSRVRDGSFGCSSSTRGWQYRRSRRESGEGDPRAHVARRRPGCPRHLLMAGVAFDISGRRHSRPFTGGSGHSTVG